LRAIDRFSSFSNGPGGFNRGYTIDRFSSFSNGPGGFNRGYTNDVRLRGLKSRSISPAFGAGLFLSGWAIDCRRKLIVKMVDSESQNRCIIFFWSFFTATPQR